MLDFGWAEFLIIAFILLLVVGPQDIPRIMYQAGKILRRLHYMKFALSQQFDDFMEKAEAGKHSEKEAEAPQETTEDTPLTMDENNPYFVKGDEEADQDDEDRINPPAQDAADGPENKERG